MDTKSNTKPLIDSFASQLLYYTSPVWLGGEHKCWYDFILKGCEPDPALLVLWVGTVTASLHWWGEFIPLRERISAEQAHDVPVKVFVIFQSLVCARHHAKYLMSVIIKP